MNLLCVTYSLSPQNLPQFNVIEVVTILFFYLRLCLRKKWGIHYHSPAFQYCKSELEGSYVTPTPKLLWDNHLRWSKLAWFLLLKWEQTNLQQLIIWPKISLSTFYFFLSHCYYSCSHTCTFYLYENNMNWIVMRKSQFLSNQSFLLICDDIFFLTFISVF